MRFGSDSVTKSGLRYSGLLHSCGAGRAAGAAEKQFGFALFKPRKISDSNGKAVEQLRPTHSIVFLAKDCLQVYAAPDPRTEMCH